MNTIGHTITSSKKDDDLLTLVSEDVCKGISNKYLCNLPDEWNIECGEKSIQYKDIRKLAIKNGLSRNKIEEYYSGNNRIDTDAHIIYLTIKSGENIIKKPIYIGEIKKQGTNDRRFEEGKDKQAIGNAACDRIPKNYLIAGDFCYLCDKELFPYTVYLHGCDFSDDYITSTTKSKLHPFFGELNKLNPFFNKDFLLYMNSKRGGSCFYQKDNFTYEQLYNICFECCEMCLKYYIDKYKN